MTLVDVINQYTLLGIPFVIFVFGSIVSRVVKFL